MGLLRIEMARRMDLIKIEAKPALLWVTDFPLYEWDEETKRYYAIITLLRLHELKISH